MTRSLSRTVEALLAVLAVAALTGALLPTLGLASAALLFLLPVLLAATRGGVGPGLVAALAGAAAYNFFLLEPRFTFRVHHLDNLISVIVLGLVAVVTSRLATRLMAREADANARARASGEASALSSLLASGEPADAVRRGLAFLAERHGDARLIDEDLLTKDDAAFSSLDRAAAAWAMHNGDRTGHGTPTMPAADWSFVPIAPRSQPDTAVAALARPANGQVRSAAELDHIADLCRLIGQARDRASLAAEREERELAEASDRLRRTFLASLAHDFRTPLTVIEGRLELLARQSPDAADALAAARRLDRMMTDLLAAARLESGTLEPACESLDLIDVMSSACDELRFPAGLLLTRSVPADLPFVSGDPVLLHHIIVNLIDNAARHACTAVAITATAGNGVLRLVIDDDGAGIAPADRIRIFERFSRLEGSDRTAGSGLGLAIVKGFADAMAMTVHVEDHPGGGARFVVAMPVSSGAAT